ncbi:hypothetical protein [Streptomyces sp. Tu 3180]|uniref:hypothetical protein n=1 Tax=Streptomyces sp. Tu 3180 TaxID=2682611 RepID=UPI001358E4DC|nr:hypothetical protein [Streptomyces sp. Tu 3180]KAF3466463.1 hypothetical protein GL259_20490 [Streptomyces sp. Tu 3180]
MAHAVPGHRGMGSAGGRSRTPDLFGERTHRIARVVTPLVLGLVFGFWAAANRRYGGPITGWNLLFGFLSALAFFVLYLAVQALAPKLRRGLRAVPWAAFAGSAVGFLVSQSGETVLRSIWLGLVVAAGLFVLLFYRYYAREEAARTREATVPRDDAPVGRVGPLG